MLFQLLLRAKVQLLELKWWARGAVRHGALRCHAMLMKLRWYLWLRLPAWAPLAIGVRIQCGEQGADILLTSVQGRVTIAVQNFDGHTVSDALYSGEADWCLLLPRGCVPNLDGLRSVSSELFTPQASRYFFDCVDHDATRRYLAAFLQAFGAPVAAECRSGYGVGWLIRAEGRATRGSHDRSASGQDSEIYLPVALGWRSRSVIGAPPPPTVVHSTALDGGSLSVVIPLRDAAALTDACIATLRASLQQREVELVLVDNGSVTQAAHALFARTRGEGHQVVHAPGMFNFSHLVNHGVRSARGELVLLLNNDVMCADGDWLNSLLPWVQRSDVGCVGTRLDYPDGRIQHLGVALGVQGLAGHPFRGWSSSAYSALGFAGGVREVTGVTGAFMLLRKEVFLAVGGFDESLPTAFNDVDFCMKLRAHGFRNLVCTDVVHTHHESYSRGGDGRMGQARVQFLAAAAQLRQRWASDTCEDPFLSPAISRADENMALRDPMQFIAGLASEPAIAAPH